MENIAALYNGSVDSLREAFLAGRMQNGNETKVSDEAGTFDTIYKSAIGLIESTNKYVQDAQQAEIDFALGNLTSTHELGVIQQKANISLQYTVAIRDKLVEAYKEIMNMQI